MQRALLNEIQRQSGYPSVTVLVNTTPGMSLDEACLLRLSELVEQADQRLVGDVDDVVRGAVVRSLRSLVLEEAEAPAGSALALCVSPSYSAAVRLGRSVAERVVVDHTFATRDLVADLNRTAKFRVATVSERSVRMLYGDARRLAEQVDENWPLEREPEQSVASWTRAVVHALRAEQRRHRVPTVLAGVDRSVRRAVGSAGLETIGVVNGNHDRTGWGELHRAAWPIVRQWVEDRQTDAVMRLDAARSQRRYTAGIDEVWSMAMDGRLEMVVVEDGYSVAARLVDGRLLPAADATAPDVIDDAVDEVIEAVLRHGGGAVIVGDGQLAGFDRIAAVARY